ncbi:MAG: hypothetical protein HYW56_01045 [Candidatus Harrisonbacteria bacterium]|nr:hypothetical protein [Candidatus Harrisonbacteria bacterium]MBI2604110.1 hypothetical protein [Candidatus Harrisonbacteria bacterium]
MASNRVRLLTKWGQWDPDTWSCMVVWRGEYSERYQAEVQTAIGTGILVVADRRIDNRVLVAMRVPLTETVTQKDSERWDDMVRERLYAPPPRCFAVRNIYRRGGRRK